MSDSLVSLAPGRDLLKPDASRSSNQLCIVFTGSGSEYFRIWIVNLLLTLVTLGVYSPWAKARRLRYFYGNTVVDGEPLGFHGDPKKMFKGFVLVGLLFGLYSVAGNFSAMAGFVAFLIVAAIWPALFKSAMQFRLANTSWRGLRFRFNGSLAGAYTAWAPLFAFGAVLAGFPFFLPNADMEKETAVLAKLGAMWPVMLAVMLTGIAATPVLMWNLKKYQHNHYALATLQTSFKATVASFYMLYFKMVLLMLVLLSTVAILGYALVTVSDLLPQWMVSAKIVVWIAGMIVMFVLIKSYSISRMQNLVWTQTGNASLHFTSTLRFNSLLWLNIKKLVFYHHDLGPVLALCGNSTDAPAGRGRQRQNQL